MDAKPHWIDNSHQYVSNGRWYTTRFLMVDKLFPLKYKAPKASEESLDLRTRSYKLAPKLIKEETLLQTRSYRSAQRSSKEVTWKGINTHQEPLIYSP
jgi:hypothetical protein